MVTVTCALLLLVMTISHTRSLADQRALSVLFFLRLETNDENQQKIAFQRTHIQQVLSG